MTSGHVLRFCALAFAALLSARCGKETSEKPTKPLGGPAPSPAAAGAGPVRLPSLPTVPPVVLLIDAPPQTSTHALKGPAKGGKGKPGGASPGKAPVPPGKKQLSVYPTKDLQIEDADGKESRYSDGSWDAESNDGFRVFCDSGGACSYKQGGSDNPWKHYDPKNPPPEEDPASPPEQPPEQGSGKPADKGFNFAMSGLGFDFGFGFGLGEPHYLTVDGSDFTTQRVGEFVLWSGVPGKTIQVRHEPYPASETVAVITAVAFEVNGHRVGIYLRPTPRVVVDGRPVGTADFEQVDLDGGGAVGTWRRFEGAALTVAVVWPDGSRTFVRSLKDTWLDVVPVWTGAPTNRARGLLGTDTGDAADDFTARDGTRVEARYVAGIDRFVESWRVTAAESLFEYEPGTSTETFVNRAFPSRAAEISAAARTRAEAVCRARNVAEGFAFESCVYDVAVTEDEAFADGARDAGATILGLSALARLDRALGRSPAPIPPAPSWTITLDASDRADAQSLDTDRAVKGALEPGKSKIYRVTVPAGTSLHVLSNRLDCPSATWDPITAVGFAFFDADGKRLGRPYPVCSDSETVPVEAGEYFLKLVASPALTGSREFDLRFYPVSTPK